MEALFEKTKNHHFLFEVTDGPLPYCPTPWEKEAVPAANPDFAHLPSPPRVLRSPPILSPEMPPTLVSLVAAATAP